MAFLVQTAVTTVLDIKITDKGRELLAKGLRDVDTFDIVKFSFGDSEIDYDALAGQFGFGNPSVSLPNYSESDFLYKLYHSGTVPSGTPIVSTSNSVLSILPYEEESVSVLTKWSPVIGPYLENYKWINLGPLKDWEFSIQPVPNTRSALIKAYDVTGSTTVKIVGQLSGKYALLKINIG